MRRRALVTGCVALMAASVAAVAGLRSEHSHAATQPGAAAAVGAVATASARNSAGSEAQHDQPSPSHSTVVPLGADAPAPVPLPSATAPWFTVHLANHCARPGDRQEIFVQSRPGYVVAYNTTYSDGKQGSAYGGAGYSPVNSDGTYRSTWVVSPNTPLGAVSVAVGTQRGKESPVTAHATFTVATSC